MEREPIFVVGSPRTGTTLLAALLGRHSLIAAGAETQFFNSCSERDLRKATGDSDWPTKAVSLIRTLRLNRKPVIELYGRSEVAIRKFLEGRPPSVRSMLEALTLTNATNAKKPRWLEKTPNHLLHLCRVRREFPFAPIIRIVRDPRDSAHSMRFLPWTSKRLLPNCFLTTEWFESSDHFFHADPTSMTCRYEDLVQNPRSVLQRICRFLGDEFEEGMMDRRSVDDGVAPTHEPWKAKVSEDIDASRAYAWKRQLSAAEIDACTCICDPIIQAFDYEAVVRCSDLLGAYPLRRMEIERFEPWIYECSARHVRLVQADHFLTARRLALLYASPQSRWKAIVRLSQFSAIVAARRLLGNRTQILAGDAFSTPFERAIVKLFSRFLNRVALRKG